MSRPAATGITADQVDAVINDIVGLLRQVESPLDPVKIELRAAREAAEQAMVLAGEWEPLTDRHTRSLVEDALDLDKEVVQQLSLVTEQSAVADDYVRVRNERILILLRIDIDADHNGERFVDRSSAKVVGRYVL